MKTSLPFKILCFAISFACILFYAEAIYEIVTYANTIESSYIKDGAPFFLSMAFLIPAFCFYGVTIFFKQKKITLCLLCIATIFVCCSLFGSVIKIDLFYFFAHLSSFHEITKTIIFRIIRFLLPICLIIISIVTIVKCA